MYYVYILRSLSNPTQTYVGFTENLKKRLHYHNAGLSPHTAKFTPWKLTFYSAFEDKQRALDFEAYLITNSNDIVP